jgi:hypothetical protein
MKAEWIIDFYQEGYEEVGIFGGEERVIRKFTKPIKTLIGMNRYIDGKLELKFFLPSIMKVKKPWGYIKLAEELNILFLTEFLCGFVREDNEKQHPECSTPKRMGFGGLVGRIGYCPFFEIDIGDFL